MKLTSEQYKAVTTPKNLAVIASAGTGKTTVLANRYLDLIQNRGATVHNILAFTFTEKAAREMQSRILASNAVKPEEMSEASISTIHAFLAGLLKRHGHHVGLENDFEIMNEHAHKLMLDYEVRKFIDEALIAKDKAVTGFLKFYGPFQLNHTITELIKLDVGALSDSECTILNPTEEINSENNKTKETLTAFILSCRAFSQRLAAERLKKKLLIYTDLETLSLKLFDENTALAMGFAKRYRHILVDEFQDIAPREFRLISYLFQPGQNELFVVGDPKQAIYGFRQADTDLFRAAIRKIVESQGEVIYLTETFRTPKTLTTLFNDGFSRLFSEDIYKAAVSHKEDVKSRLEIIVTPQKNDDNEETSKHDLYASQVAARINSLIATGVPPRAIALITNARTAMPSYAKKLTEFKIPVNFAENTEALNHPVTSLLWHVLMYLSGDRNRITQAGILRSPLFYFSESFIDHLLKSDEKDLFIGQTLDLFTATKEKERFTALCVSLKQESGLAAILTPVELTKTVISHLLQTPNANDKAICDRFMALIESWQASGANTLPLMQPMLARLKNEDFDLSLPEARDNAVNLLTVHGAKGLEFDHVFILPGTKPRPNIAAYIYKKAEGFVFKTHDCDKERTLKYKLEETASFTAIKDGEFSQTLAEVRRLVYVSLTRARQCLYFVMDPASRDVRDSIAKNPDDVGILKSYNDHLYWFAETKARLYLSDNESPQLSILLDLGSDTKSTSPEWQPAPTMIKSLPVISVTEIETFFFCPKKYQLIYADRVRPVNISPPHLNGAHSAPTKISSRERGNFFHEVLQFYDYRRGRNLDTVIDQALFNQHLTDSGDALRTAAHLLVTKLKSDRVTENILFASDESLEETKFALKFKSFILTGQIDKIVRTRDDENRVRWLVVDFKTHHTVTSEDRDRLMDEFSFQLACYALATSKSLGLKELETMVLFTNGPDFRVIKHTPESLSAAEALLENILADYLIKSANNNFPLTTHRNLCARCAFYAGNYCGVRS